MTIKSISGALRVASQYLKMTDGGVVAITQQQSNKFLRTTNDLLKQFDKNMPTGNDTLIKKSQSFFKSYFDQLIKDSKRNEIEFKEYPDEVKKYQKKTEVAQKISNKLQSLSSISDIEGYLYKIQDMIKSSKILEQAFPKYF